MGILRNIRGIPGEQDITREFPVRIDRKFPGNGEQKRGVPGEFPCFWKIGEFPGQIAGTRSRGICNEVALMLL